MKKVKIILAHSVKFIIIFVLLAVPFVSFAEGLVACDNSPGKLCGWNDLMSLINTVIKFILFRMAVPIAAIMFSYAGFLLVTAGGEAAHARTKAKDIFMNTAIGLALAIAAWLIVSTILAILGWDGTWIGLKIEI